MRLVRAGMVLALAVASLAADSPSQGRWHLFPVPPITGRVMVDFSTSWKSQASVTQISWLHVPNATLAGVALMTMTSNNSDIISTVTYGAATMTEQTSSIDTTGEAVRSTLFFLGAGVPAGEQTVTINRTNNALTIYGYLVGFVADGDIELADLQLTQNDGTLAETLVDDGSTGGQSMRCAAIFSGLDDLPAVGPSTFPYHYRDNGTTSHLFGCGSPDVGSKPVGFISSTTDDRAGYYFAVRRVP